MKMYNGTYQMSPRLLMCIHPPPPRPHPHLQYDVPFLDVAVSGCQALGGDVLDKDVAGQAQAIFCLQSERQQQR